MPSFRLGPPRPVQKRNTSHDLAGTELKTLWIWISWQRIKQAVQDWQMENFCEGAILHRDFINWWLGMGVVVGGSWGEYKVKNDYKNWKNVLFVCKHHVTNSQFTLSCFISRGMFLTWLTAVACFCSFISLSQLNCTALHDQWQPNLHSYW